MNRQIAAKDIAFDVLKYLSPAGFKAGRYIYVNAWRNELIDMSSQKLGIEIDDTLRQAVERELKQAWQVVIGNEPPA